MDATEDRVGAASEQADQEQISLAVEAIVEQRACIEQVKGMLMFIYGVDADEAFAMLRWESQHRNVKLRLLAEQISKDLEELSKSQATGRRLSSNGVLFAAHQRVAAAAQRQKDG
ncbi:MAG: hypothetical protein QOJ80_1420 [Mycobacterium sp.]|nr:hypothetical protein [Mycobacterium sp.]